MNFFAPTEAEIKEAQSGGKPTFKHNEEVTFVITGCKEQVDKEGKPLLIVDTLISGGENDGKKFGHFIRNNPTSKGIWINMLSAFYDIETIKSGTLSPASIVGKQLKSTAKESSHNGKTYINFYDFQEASNVPAMGGVPEVQESSIPF